MKIYAISSDISFIKMQNNVNQTAESRKEVDLDGILSVREIKLLRNLPRPMDSKELEEFSEYFKLWKLMKKWKSKYSTYEKAKKAWEKTIISREEVALVQRFVFNEDIKAGTTTIYKISGILTKELWEIIQEGGVKKRRPKLQGNVNQMAESRKEIDLDGILSMRELKLLCKQPRKMTSKELIQFLEYFDLWKVMEERKSKYPTYELAKDARIRRKISHEDVALVQRFFFDEEVTPRNASIYINGILTKDLWELIKGRDENIARMLNEALKVFRKEQEKESEEK